MNKSKFWGALLLQAGLGIGCANAALVHQYTFSGNANDSIGGANGTLFGNATVANGKLVLDGSGDYVELVNQYIIPTSGAYTVALSARMAGFGPSFVELISQGMTGGTGFYIGYANSTHRFRFSDATQITTLAFPSDGAEHSYVMSVSGGKGTFYIDGVQRYAGIDVASTTSGTATRFGAQFGAYGEYFNGTLDNILVFNTALNAQEVSALNNPAAVPEPASAALVFAGMGVLGMMQRRDQKKN